LTVDGTGSFWSMPTTKSVIFYAGCNGTGTVSITNGGTVTGAANSHIGWGRSAAGTVTVDGAGSKWSPGTSTSTLYVGSSGNGLLNITNGGSVSDATVTMGSNLDVLVGTGMVTVNGAGSTWTTTGAVNVGQYGNGTVNLVNGGVVSGNTITCGQSSSTAGGTINFDGGTLKAYSSSLSANWITKGAGAGNIYVKEGGAKFDTQNFSTTIGLALEHGSGTPDGGLTKLGTGTLTLSGANTYTGWTTVGGGILSLIQTCLSDAGNVRVDSGAFLNLNTTAGTDTIHYLFLGGVPQAAGTYDAANSGGYITGSGALLVSNSVLPGDANADGTVNGTDLNTVLSNYNQPGMDWWHGDFHNDGTVDGTDLNDVLSNYNQHTSVGAAVPEPSALLLAAAGLAGLLAYAWRKQK
jgi:T5SS/PEP-CTERM-associated repeat protein/autotransporter-associated beta strand protein